MAYSLSEKNRINIIRQLPQKRYLRVKTQNNLLMNLNKYTLVPHPYTFKLINLATDIIRKNKVKSVADPGTGSGIIALSLAKTFPKLKVYASDVSKPTLRTAVTNARLNNINNVKFFENPYGSSVWLWEFANHRHVDMIVSNPPFIGIKEYNSQEFNKLWPESKYEPPFAIRTTDYEGLEPYTEIFHNAVILRSKYILFECNTLHIHKLKSLIKIKARLVELYKDQEDNYRFMFIKIK